MLFGRLEFEYVPEKIYQKATFIFFYRKAKATAKEAREVLNEESDKVTRLQTELVIARKLTKPGRRHALKLGKYENQNLFGFLINVIQR